MSRHLGLDLGGSAIKVVVLEQRGGEDVERVLVDVTPTVVDAGPAGIVAQLGEVGRAASERAAASSARVSRSRFFDPTRARPTSSRTRRRGRRGIRRRACRGPLGVPRCS